MKSSGFFVLVVGLWAAWPTGAAAQVATAPAPSKPLIGFLHAQSSDQSNLDVARFHDGLNEQGYVEGQNIAIEYRWGNNDAARLPALAGDLVQRQVSVLVTAGGLVAARAAKAASTTIPIVFVTGLDPAENGFVASLNRPGGNATGAITFSRELAPKRKELLREWVGQAKKTAFLINADKRGLGEGAKKQVDNEKNWALQNFDIVLDIAEKCQSVEEKQSAACFEEQIVKSFAVAAEQGIGALLVGSDPFFTNHRKQLVALAARYSLPAGYQTREFVDVGGLMSYGPNGPDAVRQAGVYAGRILKGAHPAEMPILTPTKIELVINLSTATTLGLTIPRWLRVSADDIVN
jgi:putative ABC transport system substrate-binding protein